MTTQQEKVEFVSQAIDHLQRSSQNTLSKFAADLSNSGVGHAIRWHASDAIQAEFILNVANRLEGELSTHSNIDPQNWQQRLRLVSSLAQEMIVDFTRELVGSQLTESNSTCEYSNAFDRSKASAMRTLLKCDLPFFAGILEEEE